MPNITLEHAALTDNKIIAISQFWSNVKQHTFSAFDSCNIAYATNLKRPDSSFILIIPGRSESYLKYQELMFDLDILGYDSVIIDHRGQGLSQRLTSNPKRGYVGKFDDYAQDLQQLLTQELPQHFPLHKQCAYLLAHSMGAAISLRYMQIYPSNIKAAVLCSPMIAFNTGNIPHWLAALVINSGSAINRMFAIEPWLFIGQKESVNYRFSTNQLMHCSKRYQHFAQLYQDNPQLQLGGVTYQWLSEAIYAKHTIFKQLPKLTIPIQVLQAEEDTIVDNQAQDSFCQQLHYLHAHSCPEGKAIKFADAYHELLFESDHIRQRALMQTLAWFEQHH